MVGGGEGGEKGGGSGKKGGGKRKARSMLDGGPIVFLSPHSPEGRSAPAPLGAFLESKGDRAGQKASGEDSAEDPRKLLGPFLLVGLLK